MTQVNEGEIVFDDVVETRYDEKAAIASRYEAKDFIQVMPWQDYSDEVEEYGSLREKAEERGTDLHDAALEAAEAFDFSDDFSAHSDWDQPTERWLIDLDAVDEAKEFFEFCGFEVRFENGVEDRV